MKDKGFKWISPGKRQDGCQERIDMVVPPDMTVDDFYKCVRYGLLHKEEAVGTEIPAAPMDEQVEGQITLEEFYGDLFGKEVEKG